MLTQILIHFEQRIEDDEYVNPTDQVLSDRSLLEASLMVGISRPVVEDMLDERGLESTTLVSNGCVNYKGIIADKQTTGGWNASPFIIVNEITERLAFFAVGVSLVGYLVREMHESLPTAATHVTDWIGAAYVLTILGAFLADAYLGRFLTIIVFSCVYAVGMILLTISASIDSLRPALCTARPCIPATDGQSAFLYCSLALIALGTGDIKPCVSSFGADQFDEADEKEVLKKIVYSPVSQPSRGSYISVH
ncbi:hypothetical protein POM88_014152 [Heracleum sosnowskyi]|uniref:Peptide transporter n=1 Tax=Heracleum sosnowskyi TaxID=360622 RepID=A0AAD8J2H0_9APIA|nr:hypothetical protein POM88_014152 [Heracleum sosnowskyi]